MRKAFRITPAILNHFEQFPQHRGIARVSRVGRGVPAATAFCLAGFLGNMQRLTIALATRPQ